MVKNISFIRSIGKFDSVASGGQLPLNKLTVIYAENGRGKTTLTAILRSLSDGSASHILERTRLAAVDTPRAVIELSNNTSATFDNGVWSQTDPNIVIFDDNFVSQNVCSGIEVSSSHKQNLHELIIGAAGISLNQDLQTQVLAVEEHNKNLRDHGKAIPTQQLHGLKVDQFCALTAIADIEEQIESAKRRLAAANNAEKVVAAPVFEAVSLPKFAIEEIGTLLNRTIDDLDGDALKKVNTHLKSLGASAEEWIGEGLEHIKGEGHERTDCPLCAQDLKGSQIIDAYRHYFSASYSTHKDSISSKISEIEASHGQDAPAAFERLVLNTTRKMTFWKNYESIPDVDFDTVSIAQIWKKAREAVLSLLYEKLASPLEPISIPEDVISLLEGYDKINTQTILKSDDLLSINPKLAILKEQVGSANAGSLEADLAQKLAVKARFDPAVAPLCEAYISEKSQKEATEALRDAARTALDTHRNQAFPAYGLAINNFLQRFNASFRVGPVDVVNNRQGSSANYTLLVNGEAVPLTSANDEPSFKSALSAGDRNTLALAFFFASLQSDPNLADKIVIIDDPMTSLDDHRTLHTHQEIDRLVGEVAQVVVLSHSKPFLLGVWDKCRQRPKTSIKVVRTANDASGFEAWNVNSDIITEHDKRYERAVAYLSNPAGIDERQVAESLRPMMEAYLRVSYPIFFPPGTMLGQFHNRCRQNIGQPNEILRQDHTLEFRALLDYGNKFHHDTNTAYATEIINDAHLTDFTARTVAFIGK